MSANRYSESRNSFNILKWIYVSETEASVLDLHLSISDGFVKTKRDDFDFDIVKFQFLDSDVPRSTSYGV